MRMTSIVFFAAAARESLAISFRSGVGMTRVFAARVGVCGGVDGAGEEERGRVSDVSSLGNVLKGPGEAVPAPSNSDSCSSSLSNVRLCRGWDAPDGTRNAGRCGRVGAMVAEAGTESFVWIEGVGSMVSRRSRSRSVVTLREHTVSRES
jgi:hypothetical protein